MAEAGSNNDLKPCGGGCGRMTRPSNVHTSEELAHTVPRTKAGLCPECFTVYEKQRPMTQREREAVRQLEIFLTERRRRLGLTKGLEQFRKNPIFGYLEIPEDDRMADVQ